MRRAARASYERDNALPVRGERLGRVALQVNGIGRHDVKYLDYIFLSACNAVIPGAALCNDNGVEVSLHRPAALGQYLAELPFGRQRNRPQRQRAQRVLTLTCIQQ